MFGGFLRLFGKKKADPIAVSQVFSDETVPTLSFVDRAGNHNEIRRLQTALRKPGRIVCIYGDSKTGKTTFVQTVAPAGEDGILILDGKQIQCVESFWLHIADELELSLLESVTLSKAEAEISTEAKGGQASAGFGGTQITGGMTKARESQSVEGQTERFISLKSVRKRCIEALKDRSKWVVADDFHFSCKIDDDANNPEAKRQRLEILREIKGVVGQAGLKFVFISVPKGPIDFFRSGDGYVADAELQGRVHTEEFPGWNAKELTALVEHGFSQLGLVLNQKTLSRIAKYSYGSPAICQDICFHICSNKGISSSAGVTDQNRKVLGSEVTKAIEDVVSQARHFEVFYEDCQTAGQPDDAKSYSLKHAQNRKVSINEAIILGLIKDGLNSESGINYSTLTKWLRRNVPRHKWSDEDIRAVLTAICDLEVKQNVYRLGVYQESFKPLIFDKQNNKIFFEDPRLSMYLALKYEDLIERNGQSVAAD